MPHNVSALNLRWLQILLSLLSSFPPSFLLDGIFVSLQVGEEGGVAPQGELEHVAVGGRPCAHLERVGGDGGVAPQGELERVAGEGGVAPQGELERVGGRGGWLIRSSWRSGVHPMLGWSGWGRHPCLSWSGWGVVWGRGHPSP